MQSFFLFATAVIAIGTKPVNAEDIISNELQTIQSVVTAFHKALDSKDREAATHLLAHDVMVLENGHIETAQEYVSHHLDSDMAFSAGIKSQYTLIDSRIQGEIAWVISASRAKGEFRGTAINSAGAELMLLEQRHGAWKIKAIHWSSRQIKD